MAGRFAGRTAVVTGGVSGIGAGIAARLAAEGARLSLWDLDAAGLAKLQALAPITAVHAGMPPFLCIHGTKDDQVSYEQSPAMCQAMQKVGASCELITVEGGGHGMSTWRELEMQHWKPEMIAWLRKTLTVN